MYLKRIEIQGFKSLADKIELQFNPGVSAIVGPNGSGKSNIADAVRWVLGEQSAKSLRGAKMEDVIFAGSDKRKAVGMAEVSLTLDNSGMVFPLDYSEIMITRRVYRSGESEYLINKLPCRLKDIHELFMDTGVGREGYSIIGQGKIEEILSTRSEDRRIIIEEAAGIVKYKTRKQQAQKKLVDTEQNLLRISDIIHELETRVGLLEEQAQTAREFLTYKNELDDLEINMLVNQVEDQRGKLAEIDSRDEGLKNQLIQCETVHINIESEIEQDKLAAGKLDEEIASVQAETYHTGSRIEKHEAEIMVAHERLNGLNNQKESLLDGITGLQKRTETEKNRQEGEAQTLASLRKKIESEKERLSGYEQQLFDAETGLTGCQQEIEERKADLIDLLNEMAAAKNIINSAEVELNNLSRRGQQLDEQARTLRDEYTAAVCGKKDFTTRLEELNTEIYGLKAEDNELTAKELDLQDKLARTASEMEGIREKLQERSSRLSVLSELQLDYEGYYLGVKEVLLAGKSGNCRGISGVVAEIIKVPPGYDTAVEAALGSALQYIVTETDDDARKAIEFLKRNKSGRATFLPLNIIKPPKDTDTAKITCGSGIIGWASELISFDGKYSVIIEYLLGRVIVAEDIKAAVELARKTKQILKIVTLDGDVINPGGAMTGGVYQKGKTSLLGRLREIEEITAEKQNLIDTAARLEFTLTGTREEIRQCGNRLTAVREMLQGLYIKQNSFNKDLAAARQEINRTDSTLSMLESEKQAVEEDVKNTQCRVNKNKELLRELESQDDSLRETINLKQGLISGQEEERARLAEIVTEKKVILARLLQEEQNYAQLMKRAAESIREMEEQTGAKEILIIEIEKQKDVINRSVEEHESEIRLLTKEKGTGEEHVNRLRNDRNAFHAGIADKENRVRILAKEIALKREQLHASDVKRARCEFEIENLITKLADEFGMTCEQALLRKTEIRNRRETAARIKDLKEAIASLGNVNLGAIEEFARVSERYEFLQGQYQDLEQAKESLYRVIAEMDQIMTKRFGEAFTLINSYFGEVFNRFFGGGRAELVLTDSGNLLECGIEIIAQPPGKKPQHLSLLSGGEKALTAISLLFAVLKAKPSPFCVLDEIEASLDDANVDRFAGYLGDFAQSSQFIVITHRKRTMEAADILYGVTMDESGVSKLVSMKLSEKTGTVDMVS